MVSEVQGECVLSETVLLGLCDFTYSVPNPVKPQSLDESFIRCYGRLGHLGNSERGENINNRVHRERDHDGSVFSSSDVDVRREDRKQLEEDTGRTLGSDPMKYIQNYWILKLKKHSKIW